MALFLFVAPELKGQVNRWQKASPPLPGGCLVCVCVWRVEGILWSPVSDLSSNSIPATYSCVASRSTLNFSEPQSSHL